MAGGRGLALQQGRVGTLRAVRGDSGVQEQHPTLRSAGAAANVSWGLRKVQQSQADSFTALGDKNKPCTEQGCGSEHFCSCAAFLSDNSYLEEGCFEAKCQFSSLLLF